jgi:ribosomal protein S18 acetylase RimI-like enzyme
VQGDADLVRMLALVRAFPDENRHVVDLPYRLCSPSVEIPANSRLWEDDAGHLLGWAAWQQPFITLDLALHPHARSSGLEDEMLRWSISHFEALAREKGRALDYVVDAREDDAERRALLERHGFAPSAHWQQYHLQRLLHAPIPVASPPAGFTLRSLAGPAEAPAAAAVQRAAFDSENMTDHWRRRVVQSSAYIPDLDVVAAAPDGRLAAFCLCWLDRTDPERVQGQIEPLAVHPDCQRLGLGRAVLLEGLRRMQAHGAQEAHIEVDNMNDAAGALYTGHGGFTLAYRAMKYYRTF